MKRTRLHIFTAMLIALLAFANGNVKAQVAACPSTSELIATDNSNLLIDIIAHAKAPIATPDKTHGLPTFTFVSSKGYITTKFYAGEAIYNFSANTGSLCRASSVNNTDTAIHLAVLPVEATQICSPSLQTPYFIATNGTFAFSQGCAQVGHIKYTMNKLQAFSIATSGTYTLNFVNSPTTVDITILSAPTVSITSSATNNFITAGTSVTFTSATTNLGDTISYRWYKNGVRIKNSDSISGSYTDANLANNDVILCVLASKLSGGAFITAQSNGIIMDVCTPTTASLAATACGSYTWHGNTYTTSGTYTFDTLNTGGCDSLTTLNLTINQPSTATLAQTAYNSYAWHGTNYTASGAYTFDTTNSVGCDSLTTLNLIILSPNITSFSPAYACMGSTVTITGGGFTGASAVLFGGVPATSYAVVNDTTITATVANGYSGLISVVVNGSTLTSSESFSVASALTNVVIIPNAALNALNMFSADDYHLINTIPIYARSGGVTMIKANKAKNKVYAYYQGNLTDVNVLTNRKKVILDVPTTDICESPDGHRLYVAHQVGSYSSIKYCVSVIDADADTVMNTIYYPNIAAQNATGYTAISPDGNTLYYYNNVYSKLFVLDAHTLASISTIAAPASPVTVSTDGKTLYAANGKALWKYDIATGTETNTTITTLTSITSIIAAPDSSTLYISTYSKSFTRGPNKFPSVSNVVVYHIADNSHTTLTPNFGTQLSLSLSPDGSKLYAASTFSSSRVFAINTTTYDTSSVTLIGSGSNAIVGNMLQPCTPTITSFTPAKACPGSTVNITGSSLSWASAMIIGGASVASFTVNNDTSITAIMGAKSHGNIIIGTFAGAAFSADSILSNASTATLAATACGSYSWHGNTYTISGSYTFDSLNTAGCDSLITLNLTINQPTTATITQSATGSYSWHGTTYTTSGSYTYSTKNVGGCDSVATLNLTIKQISTSSDSINACTSYTWHGTTYTASGNYTYTTTNAIGCDSIVTLKLHLKAPADVVTVSGANNTCEDGKATQLASNFIGGIWSTKSSSILVNSNGFVSGKGTANAFDTVKYYCSTDSATKYFTYLPYTVIGSIPITGPTAVCTGSTIQLQTKVLTYAQNIQNGATGVWTVQNPTRGTIDASGVFTGGTPGGKPIVIYALTNKLGCVRNLYDTSVVLNALPTTKPVISGPTSVCTQTAVQLSATPAGASHAWGVQNAIRGSITNAGLLTGASSGANAIVTYKYTDINGCSSPVTYYNVYVNASTASPHITTLSGTYCVGSSYNFAATPVGGTWSTNNAVASITSSNTSAATAKINSAGSFGVVYKTAADVNGCKATTTFTRSTTTCVLPTVALDTLSGSLEVARIQSGSVSVYPNPARGVVTLNIPSVSANSNFSIADITGKIVKTQSITDKQTKVSISNLKSGIYFISIQSAEGKTTKKMIINN